MRPLAGQVCQSLMGGVELEPGVAARVGGIRDAAHQLARPESFGGPPPSARNASCQSPSATTAFMKASVTRTELLAFWNATEPYAAPSSELS